MFDDIPAQSDSIRPSISEWAYDQIWASLHYYSWQQTGDAKAFQFDQPTRKSSSPDYDFFIYGLTFGPRGEIPAFAAVVRLEGDYGPESERTIATEINDFFREGIQVVWDVDVLENEVIRVYGNKDLNQLIVYHRGEIADAEPALPGWRMPVDEL